MSGWILASGGNEFSEKYKEADLAALAKRTKTNTPLLIVVTAPFPTQDLAYKTAEKYFNSCGIETIMSPILSENDLTKENISQLENSPGIYFAGGTPSRLTKTFVGTDAEIALRNALEKDCVIMGSSAGAMLFGTKVVMPGGMDLGPGLDFLKNQIVLAHFQEPWPNWAPALKSQGFSLLGLSEGSSVLTSVTSVTSPETFGNVFSV